MDDALKLQLDKLQLTKVTSTDKIIGRGAYGKVIEVYVHGTLCAAKEIHPTLIENVSAQESEAIRRSFYEECVIASRIHHPNVVQMLGIYYPTPQAKLPWLVMEMMKTNLKGFLEKHEEGKVPLHFKISILVDVTQGLEFLHGQDIIHRDLSSNNVLLTRNLVAKIADLGVAKVVEQNKMKTYTQAPGTTHFMPPEALWNKPRYGKPVDVFSLACVILHMMSHLWPEPKERVSEDTMTVLTETQRRDKYITFCTQPALKELVELCLLNKPEQRPEISTVFAKLKQLKVTIEKQVPFATDNNYELFDVVRQTNIHNQKLSTANKHLTEAVAQLEATVQRQEKEKYKLLQEKDQQISEKDQQIRKKDQQIQEKDQQMQKKNQQLQEKDQEIKELQMMITSWNAPTYSEHHKEKVAVSDNSPEIAAVPNQPTPEASQEPPIADSKYGKTNVNYLKDKLQYKKVVTQTVAQTGGAGLHPQSTKFYVNYEIPIPDSTNKSNVGLTSLRSGLEKSKEERTKAVVAKVNEKSDFYNLSDYFAYIPENPVIIDNPPDKKPMAGPRLKTPVNLASSNTHSSSLNRTYKLWQCAQCRKTNETQHVSCKYCKLTRGKMADRSVLCEFCQLITFIPPAKGEVSDTCCPTCKTVYESVF